MGFDCSVPRSEVSFGHFGTGAKMSDTLDPSEQCQSVSVPN